MTTIITEDSSSNIFLTVLILGWFYIVRSVCAGYVKGYFSLIFDIFYN